MIVTNAERLEDVLCRVFTGEEDADALLDEVREVRTFADSGLLTRDRGIVLRLAQGQEFQVTIVLSERARGVIECVECGEVFADLQELAAHLIDDHDYDNDIAAAQVAAVAR